jgi:hypothetical protein
MKTKVVQGFVWLLVTDKAKEVYQSGLFSLYILHDDDGESLAESYDDITLALENGLGIGIEVGHLTIRNHKDEGIY